MKYLLPVFFAIMIFASCKKERPHLPKEKMKQVLNDLFIAESYSTAIGQDSTRPGAKRNTDSLARFYEEIFHHHQVSREDFNYSIRWYEEHPEDLDSLFNDMIKDLNKHPLAIKPAQ